MAPSTGTAKEFQPDFLGNGCRLSSGDMDLYRLLKRLERGARRKGMDFRPRQKVLATKLGVCRRTIQLRLDRLELAGLITRRRTNRSNRYYFPETCPDNEPTGATAGAMDCASEGASSCASESKAPLEGLNKNSKSAAAADLFLPIEIQEASQGLQDLGFPCPLADRYARKDAALVLEALPFLRWKINVKGDVRDKVKVIRSVLNDPGNWGFTFGADGRWKAPHFGKEACAPGLVSAPGNGLEQTKQLLANMPAERSRVTISEFLKRSE
jgi:hypothetical protein